MIPVPRIPCSYCGNTGTVNGANCPVCRACPAPAAVPEDADGDGVTWGEAA
jgi:hypothetical protein